MTKSMVLESRGGICTVCHIRLKNVGKRKRKIIGLEGMILLSYTAWYCASCKRLSSTAPGIAGTKCLYSDRVVAKVRGLLRHMSRGAAAKVIYLDHGFWIPLSTIGEWD